MANNKNFKVKTGFQAGAYHDTIGSFTDTTIPYQLDAISRVKQVDNDDSAFTNVVGTTVPGVFVKPDGTKLFLMSSSNDTVYQYSMSTAFDVSTATYDSKSVSVSVRDSNPANLIFNPDGTKFFFSGRSNDVVYQFNMSTAWDVSTATYSQQESIATDGDPYGLRWRPGGYDLDVLMVDFFGTRIHSERPHTLYNQIPSNSYNMNTLVLSSFYFLRYNLGFTFPDVFGASLADNAQARDFVYLNDGYKLWVYSAPPSTDYYSFFAEYNLAEPYKWETAEKVRPYPIFRDMDDSSRPSFQVVDDGKKMIMANWDQRRSTQSLVQYSLEGPAKAMNLSTGSVFEHTIDDVVTRFTLTNPSATNKVSSATLVLNGPTGNIGPDITSATYSSKSLDISTDVSQRANCMAISDDGTKAFFTSNNTETVYSYTLSTAFDISTATYDSGDDLDTSSQTASTGLYSIQVKPDGTELYVTDNTSNGKIYQYTLSTGWDLGTATFTRSQALNLSDATRVTSMLFKPDGTTILLKNDEFYYELGLSTAWDISTITQTDAENKYYEFVTNPLVEADMEGAGVNSTGSLIAFTDYADDDIKLFEVGVPWDVGSLRYTFKTFSVSSQATTPSDIKFSSDSTKMYVVDRSGSAHQYSVPSADYSVVYDPKIKWKDGVSPSAPASNKTDVITFTTTDGGDTYVAERVMAGI